MAPRASLRGRSLPPSSEHSFSPHYLLVRVYVLRLSLLLYLQPYFPFHFFHSLFSLAFPHSIASCNHFLFSYSYRYQSNSNNLSQLPITMNSQGRRSSRRNFPRKSVPKTSKKSPTTRGTTRASQASQASDDTTRASQTSQALHDTAGASRTSQASYDTPHASQASQSRARNQHSVKHCRFYENNRHHNRSDTYGEGRPCKQLKQIYEPHHLPGRQEFNATSNSESGYHEHTDGEADYERYSDNDNADYDEDYGGDGQEDAASEDAASAMEVNHEGGENTDEDGKEPH